MQDGFSLQELAGLLKIHRHTLTSWVKRGCPYIEKPSASNGQQWKFDLAAVVRWREDMAVQAAVGDTSKIDIAEARRRKVAAEATLAELDVKVRNGELVEIEPMAEVIGKEYAHTRARLLAIPSKVAPILETTPGILAKQDIVREAIYEALAELSADKRPATEFAEAAE